MGSMTASNADGVFEATRGNIRAARTPGGNITIDTTHTVRGLMRHLDSRCPHIEIENADLDDAIAALQALRGDWQPKVGDDVEVLSAARRGQWGRVVRDQGGRLPWVVRSPDGCETGYAAHEVQPWREQARYTPVALGPDAVARASRAPDIVRKIEESNERMIAFLEKRLPVQSAFDPATARPGEPTCSRCGARLMFSARERGDGLCGPCSRTPLEVIGNAARKLGAMAVEIADRPHPSFQAIAGKAPLTIAGRWRVYFNKHGRSDLPWCVAPDAGGWEIAVSTVEVTRKLSVHPPHQAQIVHDGEAILRTVYQPKATPDDEDGRPSAWIAIEGRLTVIGGRASIAASAAPEVQHP